MGHYVLLYAVMGMVPRVRVSPARTAFFQRHVGRPGQFPAFPAHEHGFRQGHPQYAGRQYFHAGAFDAA